MPFSAGLGVNKMKDRRLTPGTLRRALPALVLAAVAAALVLSSTAVAEDPPIVSAGPIDVGGTAVTGSAGTDPEADACIGNQHSGADAEETSALQLNDAACQSSTGGGATSGGGSQSTSGGARPTGSAGTTGAAGQGSALASVAAADAVGLRIVGVKRLLKNVRLSKNFRMLVTIKDGRGLRVRGAIVSVSRVPGSKRTVSGMHAGFSNKIGVARVLVPVTTKMFGNRVFLKITARTPKAQAVTLRSVLLPRLR
jgi:hypothetical protein